MARSFSEKKRDSFVKTPKPLLLLIAEGRNVTETQYFRQFQQRYSTFNIKVLICTALVNRVCKAYN